MESLQACLSLCGSDVFKQSEVLYRQQQFGKAHALQLLAIKKEPGLIHTHTQQFIVTLCEWIIQLSSLGLKKQALTTFDSSVDLTNIDRLELLHLLTSELCGNGEIEIARTVILASRMQIKDDVMLLETLDRVNSHLVDRWHFNMLNDVSRNKAFADAIENAYQKGLRQAIDIGSGSGILSLAAAHCGFGHVFACEGSSVMHQIAKGVLNNEDENVKRRITLINKLSTLLVVGEDIPHRLPLAVTEVFDCALIGEGVITTMKHALENLLTNDAKIIPASATVFGMVIESDDIARHFRLLQRKVGHLDLSKFKVRGVREFTERSRQPYTTERLTELRHGYKALTDAFEICHVEFGSLESLKALESFSSQVSVTTIASGSADAVVVWFRLDLDEKCHVSTAPGNASCWEQAVYPLDFLERGRVRAGLALDIHCNVSQDCLHVSLASDALARRPNDEYDSQVTCIPLTRQLVNRYNDLSYISNYQEAFDKLRFASDRNTPAKCLFISHEFSLLPFFGNKIGQHIDLHVNNASLLPLYKQVADSLATSCPKLVGGSQQDVSWDVVVAEMIEPFGQFNSQAFVDTSVFRATLPKGRTMAFCPSRIVVMGTLISSPVLTSRNRVANDDVTLGFDIATYMNEYEAVVHPNVDLVSLPHHDLSESFELFDFEFRSDVDVPLEVHRLVSTTASQSGELTGVALWHQVVLCDGIEMSTQCHSKTHWRQTVVMFKATPRLRKGDTVHLDCRFANGNIHVSLQGR